MADLIYNRSKNKLEWSAKGLVWKAVSGPYRDPLPAGSYKVARKEVTPYTSAIDSPYQDASGKGFFLPIYPKFSTSRNGLGIHPDGNVDGTEGCIGLVTNPGASKASPKKLHDALKTVPLGKKLTLRVK